MRLNLDSAPHIYLVEEVAPYASALEARLAAPDVIQVCSELTRLECRAKPIRDGEDALLSAFDSHSSEIVGRVIPLSRQVMEQATLLRARYGFRTPDSIHLAAAIVDECDLFLTSDRRLVRCSEIVVEAV